MRLDSCGGGMGTRLDSCSAGMGSRVALTSHSLYQVFHLINFHLLLLVLSIATNNYPIHSSVITATYTISQNSLTNFITS